MIIVTGAAGFIGYRVAKALQKRGDEVIGVDELVFFGSRAEHQDVAFEQTLSPEVILDAGFFQEQIDAGKAVTGIIHMGACSDTTEMRVDYLKRVNLNYSQTLWNLACQFKIPFIYASSAATYGGGEAGYADQENKFQVLKPLNPYGESKRLFDIWALEQEQSGHTPPAWSGFKFFNVYGFGERHKGKMASVVLQGFDQIREKGSLRLFKSHRAGIADGEQKRDFIYVGDVVEVLLFAIDRPLRRGIYNLGSGEARSFRDLAIATFKALKLEPKIEFIDTPLEIRDRYQYFTEATMDKLRGQGYTKPFTELEAGVEATIRDLALRSSNPFPLLEIGAVPYLEQKLHAEVADAHFGYRIDEIEKSLTENIQDTHLKSTQWIGLKPATLQTPYTEIRQMLARVQILPKARVVDLGAGYGRMGLVMQRHYAEAFFIGVEIAQARAEEGKRIFARERAENALLLHGDLSSDSFQLPDAQIYFLYDLSVLGTIQKVLLRLKERSKQHAVTLIGRGRATRDQVERNEPWLSTIVRPEHFGNFSVYRSAEANKS